MGSTYYFLLQFHWPRYIDLPTAKILIMKVNSYYLLQVNWPKYIDLQQYIPLKKLEFT